MESVLTDRLKSEPQDRVVLSRIAGKISENLYFSTGPISLDIFLVLEVSISKKFKGKKARNN